MHKVTVDRARLMVCSTASGFFTLADLERAAAELHDAIRSLGRQAGQHVSLYDYTEVQVAPPAVLERLGRYFTDPGMKPLWARRVAFVTGSTLLGRQLQRIQRENMRLFADRRTATAWLLSGAEQVAA